MPSKYSFFFLLQTKIQEETKKYLLPNVKWTLFIDI